MSDNEEAFPFYVIPLSRSPRSVVQQHEQENNVPMFEEEIDPTLPRVDGESSFYSNDRPGTLLNLLDLGLENRGPESSMRREWRSVTFSENDLRIAKKLLDVRTHIRICNFSASGSGWMIRWMIYRSKDNRFFVVYWNNADPVPNIDDFVFYEYTEQMIRDLIGIENSIPDFSIIRPKPLMRHYTEIGIHSSNIKSIDSFQDIDHSFFVHGYSEEEVIEKIYAALKNEGLTVTYNSQHTYIDCVFIANDEKSYSCKINIYYDPTEVLHIIEVTDSIDDDNSLSITVFDFLKETFFGDI